MNNIIECADVLEALKGMESNSVDCGFCDPPYALEFMGSEWDKVVPSAEVWKELLRVLKPGGYLLAFGGPRTHHRLMCNIEDAGFVIKDCLMWLYGSGFPKSHSISKAITAKERYAKSNPTSLRRARMGKRYRPTGQKDHRKGNYFERPKGYAVENHPTLLTHRARAWAGYGSALKPAYEPIILAMRPCDRSYAQNALTHGIAGLNIDGCRIACNDNAVGCDSTHLYATDNEKKTYDPRRDGRWPANLILDEASAENLDAQNPTTKSRRSTKIHKGEGIGNGVTMKRFQSRCAVVGGYNDAGGPSRFFYCPKAGKKEREAGLLDLPPTVTAAGRKKPSTYPAQDGTVPRRNTHPCVKPIELCRWLATLILPPDRDGPRRLLVPYAGTGSEMIGASLAGWEDVFGIEFNREYVACAQKRIAHWTRMPSQAALLRR